MGGRKGNITKFPRMKGSESRKMQTLGHLKIPEAHMNSACTVAEVVQISLAAAEDTVTKYTGEVNKLVIQQTLFIEGLKRALKDKTGLTEDEFSVILKEVAENYQKERDEYLEKILNKEKEEEPSIEVKEETEDETENN